jgi:hypothetical protein
VGEKVAVVGSREWTDHLMIRDFIYSLDEDDVVISGGARGVDQFAELYARERGLAVLVFSPAWDTHGRKAGLIRNQDIVDACDRLVAFWDKSSKGTAHALNLARAADKPVLVFHAPSD